MNAEASTVGMVSPPDSPAVIPDHGPKDRDALGIGAGAPFDDSFDCEMTVQQLVDAGILERPVDGNHGEIHPKSSDFVPAGVPFIMASDLVDGRVDTTNCKFISKETASGLRKGFARANDVLLSHKATIGRTAIVENDSRHPFLVLTPQVTYYRVRDPKRLDHRYLRHYFDSRDFQDLFVSWSGGGSTRAYLGITAQADLPIAVPPIDQQLAIARILGALDDKIELNRRMNRTLETLAQRLFKSWFVDFDPVVARSQGRKPYALSDDLAALFPNALEDSSIGPIPSGWRVASLDSLAEFRNGLAMQKFPSGPIDSLPVLKIAELRAGSTDGADQASADLDPRFVVIDGDLIFSWSGSLMVDIWAGGKAALNQHLFKVVPNGVPLWFCHHWILEHLDDFQGIAADKATTMGHIRRHHLSEALLARPDDALIEKLDALIAPLCERVLQNKLQNRKLAALRDLLLPKLFSGEIRVPVAEKEVEGSATQ